MKRPTYRFAPPGLLALAAAILLAAPLCAEDLNALRLSQEAELRALREAYDARARAECSRPDGTIDTDSAGYQQLLENYRRQSSGVRETHARRDPRPAEIQSTLGAYQGDIMNTGSQPPKDVRGDVDLAARNNAVAERLAGEWRARGDRVRAVTTPDGEVVKYVNQTTDTTLWTPETPGIREVKLRDPDAWTAEGALKGAGNRDAMSDPRGYALENEKKLLHAVETGDLKTGGKSIDKVGQDNRLVTPENAGFYDRAQRLRNYQDPAEAGIVALGDAPEAGQRKVEAWTQQAQGEMARAREVATERGALREEARRALVEDLQVEGAFSGSPDASARWDAAGRIQERMDRVQQSNAEVERLNAGQRVESGSAVGDGAAPEGGSGARAEGLSPDAAPTVRQPLEASAGRVDEGMRTAPIDLDEVARFRATGLRGESAFAPPEATPGQLTEQVIGAVQVGAGFGDAGVRQAGQAIDQNRDLTLQDAGTALVEGSGAPGMYAVGYEASRREQLRVERGEQGQVSALANTAVNAGDALFVQPARDIVKQNVDELEARARAEGRQATMAEGAGMYLGTLAEVAGAFSGVKTLTEAMVEPETYEARAEAAAQRQALGQFVDQNLAREEREVRRLAAQLESQINSGDASDPATRAAIEQTLAAYDAEYEKLERLAAMTARALGASDSERTARVARGLDSAPDAASLRDYANDIVTQRGGTPLAPTGTTPAKLPDDLGERIMFLAARASDPTTPPEERRVLEAQLLAVRQRLDVLRAQDEARTKAALAGTTAAAGGDGENPDDGTGVKPDVGGGGGGEADAATDEDAVAAILLELMGIPADGNGDGATVAGLKEGEAAAAGSGGADLAGGEGTANAGLLDQVVDREAEGSAQATDDALTLMGTQAMFDDAAAVAANAEREGQATVERAQIGGDQVQNAARNEANATDAMNSWGSQLTAGTAEAIRSGMQAAGTAIGTAVGEDIANDDDERRNRERESESQGATGEPRDATPVGTQREAAPEPPQVSPEPDPPPEPVGSPCPICGRTNCAWWKSQP